MPRDARIALELLGPVVPEHLAEPRALPGAGPLDALAAALSAVVHGASIIRVHDVRETVDALKVWRAIEQGNEATS